MLNGNYYHRTHKNFKPDTRGKVDQLIYSEFKIQIEKLNGFNQKMLKMTASLDIIKLFLHYPNL